MRAAAPLLHAAVLGLTRAADAATPAPGGCQFVSDTDMAKTGANTILHIQDVADADACCAQCQAHPGCVAGVYYPPSMANRQGCWLKDNAGSPTAMPNATACITDRPSPPLTPLTLLSTDVAAKCLDGTPGGYYYEAAKKGSETKWLLRLQSGGECVTDEECAKAVVRSPSLVSSDAFANATTFGFLQNGNAAINPVFSTWNRVFLPYCTQDLWTGQVLEPSNATFGRRFAGHLLLSAILDALDKKGLGSATEIIFSGESAGGIGVWPNLDWLAQRYSKARVVGAPIAGFYFYVYPYTGPNHTSSVLTDFRPAAWPQHYELWNSFVDEDCKKAYADSPGGCILANISYPHITTPKYIVQSLIDRTVTKNHDWLPFQGQAKEDWDPPELDYLRQWAANMTHALAPALSPSSPDGVFLPSCYVHTTFYSGVPNIGGTDFMQGFTDWYLGTGKPTKLHDTCGILCNPTCP